METDSKPLEADLSPTRYPSLDLPEIVDSRAFYEGLEGIGSQTCERPLTEWEILKGIYGPLDLTKVKLSKGTARNYSRWLQTRINRERQGGHGNRNVKTRRLKNRLRVLRQWKYQEKYQPDYRMTMRGRYMYRKKKAHGRNQEFLLTEDEFTRMHRNLGNVPGTDIPYYKMLSNSSKGGLQMRRIDSKLGWFVENIVFFYKRKEIARGIDLLSNKE